jgi:hypothetical protein
LVFDKDYSVDEKGDLFAGAASRFYRLELPAEPAAWKDVRRNARGH